MRTVIAIATVLLFGVLQGAVWALDDPVSSSTVPPSSLNSGLIRSPNPIDTSSNLLVTGNVGGGMHFRGDVPYNSASEFWGGLESTALDSFVRRSAGSGGN